MRAFAWFAALFLALPMASGKESLVCGVKKRHLTLESEDSDRGSWTIVLNDFATLASNPSLIWEIDAASASSVEFKDRFGFPWAPAAGKGSCRVETSRETHSLTIEISCQKLVASDGVLPGFLSPPEVEFSCPLD